MPALRTHSFTGASCEGKPKIGERGNEMLVEEQSLIEAIRSNHADDTARLVYADWLEEHEEELKAGYSRIL
jgi:uncharacterized protein (TIGR02996 family)